MNRLLAGTVAGLTATAPMTAAMELLHRQLPLHERYSLPPRQITENVADKTGAARHLNGEQRTAATWIAHFAYGTSVGGLYGPLAARVPGPAVGKGIAYGLLVWSGSSLGLLPALGLLSPATRHPPRRTALMIAAHIVWGATLGVLTDMLESSRKRWTFRSFRSWR